MYRFFFTAALALLAVPFPPIVQAAPKPGDLVVVGCLKRNGQDFSIKDFRSGATYWVQADGGTPATTLSWQVGHELEIHGSLETQGAPARQSGQGVALLKASSAIYITPTCHE